MTIFRSNILLMLPLVSAIRCYHIGTAQSVHSAIRRGLRKSRGIAFRGKTNPDYDDPRQRYMRKHDLPDYSNYPRRRAYNENYFAQKKDRNSSSWNNNKSGYNETSYNRSRYNESIYNTSSRGTSTEFNRSSYASEPINFWDPDGKFTKSIRENLKNQMKHECSHEQRIGNSVLQSHNKDPYGEDSIKNPITSQGQEVSLNRRTRRALQFGKLLKPKKNAFQPNPWPWTESKHSREKNDILHDKQLQHKNDSFRLENPVKYSNFKGFDSGPTEVPIHIKYTTPSSQFLYGSSVIKAALESYRDPQRQFYKLYIHTSDDQEEKEHDDIITNIAKSKGVPIQKVDKSSLRILDKMSQGRPHNGYVLEASQIPKLPVKSLSEFITKEDEKGLEQQGLEVEIDQQSREDAAVNGTSNFVRTRRLLKGEKPLVLLIDGIMDPGNLGGIIRTAFFLGVSAIAISTLNCAPFSPVVLKASAGASEFMPLLSVKDPAEFLLSSKKAGWYLYAAVVPSQISSPEKRPNMSLDELSTLDTLIDTPSIIILGGEGEGLRRSIRNKANLEVYIPGCENQGFNSLNVTVAAGLILNAFRQRIQMKYYSSIQSSGVTKPQELKVIISNTIEQDSPLMF